MISIVICSKIGTIDNSLNYNIKDTIGENIGYEVIVIDNSKNDFSIFSAYNEGVKKAKYQIICFMHEDILYLNKNWGNSVINCFEDNTIGLCGVIGSKYISRIPCGWWLSYSRRGYVTERRTSTNVDINYGRKKLERVVTIDGLWFCIKKSLFAKISFDSYNFKGFHCYDMDISLQVLSINYQIALLNDVNIYHKSQGCINNAFYFNSLILLKKWYKILPIYVDIDNNEIKNNDNFVKTEISKISRENYFYHFTHSLPFLLISKFDRIFSINSYSVLFFLFIKGFSVYCKIVNLLKK